MSPLLKNNEALYLLLERLAQTRHPVDNCYDLRNKRDKEALETVKQILSIGLNESA
jgi:hypothetical protein